jgi:propanediol utilization protein
VIAASRHIHMNPQEAQEFGVVDFKLAELIR